MTDSYLHVLEFSLSSAVTQGMLYDGSRNDNPPRAVESLHDSGMVRPPQGATEQAVVHRGAPELGGGSL